jgi:predicted enzyme related to lactoylglutathione lyase
MDLRLSPTVAEGPGQPTLAPGDRSGRPGPVPVELPAQPGPASAERRGQVTPVVEPGQSPAGTQLADDSDATGRIETVGGTEVRQPRPPLPGLQLQPLVHVNDMAAAVAFYEKLGGEINHGDRSGEWVLMQVGTAQIGLVTRPPNASCGEGTVELNFTATMPLDRLEKLLREQGVIIVKLKADPDLGTQLHVETPEGMPIKIHQVEPELLV